MKSWLHNFICGAGTLLDIMPAPRTGRISAAKAILAKSNAEALYGDWEKIGADFWKAIRQVETEINGRGSKATQSTSSARPETTAVQSSR